MKLKNYRPLISRNFFEMRDLAEAEAKTRTAVDLRISKFFREITAGLTKEVQIVYRLFLVSCYLLHVHTLEFLIDDLFVYSGHIVIQKGGGNIVFLF